MGALRIKIPLLGLPKEENDIELSNTVAKQLSNGIREENLVDELERILVKMKSLNAGKCDTHL